MNNLELASERLRQGRIELSVGIALLRGVCNDELEVLCANLAETIEQLDSDIASVENFEANNVE